MVGLCSAVRDVHKLLFRPVLHGVPVLQSHTCKIKWFVFVLRIAVIYIPHCNCICCERIVSLNYTFLFSVQYHAWYKEKFEDYPRDRKAVFPFLV